MGDFKRSRWLAIRETPKNLWRRIGRVFWSGGTYVRQRKDRVENERLAKFQQTCNRGYATREKKRREKP